MAKIKRIDKNDTLEQRVTDDLDASTLLGKEVMRQFRTALANKKSQQVGDYTLHQLLKECYAARDDRTLCQEHDMLDRYPEWVGMPVSIVSFKVGILVALIRESLVDVAHAPFIIDPTPVPDIPQEQKDRILDELTAKVEELSTQVIMEQQAYVAQAQEQAAMMGMPIDPNTIAMQPDFPQLDPKMIEQMVREQKIKMHQEIKQHAEEQAQLLQRDLYDKTIEGGYRKAIMEFADDFATYPYACLHGPFPTIKQETVWKDNKFTEEKKVVWGFERVSPFDLFWTEDCTSPQDGTAIFIRKQVGYDYLYDCRQLAKDDPKSGYDFDAIDDLIEKTKESRIPRNWTEFDAKNPEVATSNLLWSRGDSAEILIRYGRFSGYDLDEMGFDDLDDEKLYETKIIMCGGQVIYCTINKNPSQYKRPVFTASFESRNGTIVGVGLGQKLLAIHKAYRAVIHLAMFNLGLSSEPITEVEANRILQYMPDDWIDEPLISPGMVIPADGDRMGNGSRAIKFTQIPNTTQQALHLANFIFEQAHIISNIPAALHGQPVGSGANRTVRGLLTLQGNTLKPIQSALINLDLGVIEPMVTLLYMLLVMYEDDFEYSGDSKIIAKGAASMVQREMEKQTAMENLQILGQLGQQVNPEILNRTMVKLLQTAGVLEPGEEAIMQTPPQMGMPPQAQGMPGQPPAAPAPQGQMPPLEPMPPVQ